MGAESGIEVKLHRLEAPFFNGGFFVFLQKLYILLRKRLFQKICDMEMDYTETGGEGETKLC